MTNSERREHQLDAERAVLGSMLIDEHIIPDLMAMVDAADFCNPDNRLIFNAARALYRNHKPVDAISIRDSVGVNYADYMVQLAEITPTSANWREYAELMHKQATLGRIKLLADKLGEAMTLEECRPAVADLNGLLSSGTSVSSWNMAEMLEDFCKAQDPDAPPPEYIETGFDWLDEGLFIIPGAFVMLGGFPSSGKTAMALSMAHAIGSAHKVGFFSLETSKTQVRDRLVTTAAQVNLSKVLHHTLDEQDWGAVARMSKDFSEREVQVIDESCMDVDKLAAISQALGFDVVFIDYLQLLQPYDRRINRNEQMAEVSRALKIFGQETKTTVFGLVQLNRPADKSSAKTKAPTMQDIRDSGQFEQDADVIMMLYEPTEKETDVGNRKLSVVKNKVGKSGVWFGLDFDGATQTFSRHKRDVTQDYIAKGKLVKSIHNVPAEVPQVTFEELTQASEEIDSVFPVNGGEAG